MKLKNVVKKKCESNLLDKLSEKKIFLNFNCLYYSNIWNNKTSQDKFKRPSSTSIFSPTLFSIHSPIESLKNGNRIMFWK